MKCRMNGNDIQKKQERGQNENRKENCSFTVGIYCRGRSEERRVGKECGS